MQLRCVGEGNDREFPPRPGRSLAGLAWASQIWLLLVLSSWLVLPCCHSEQLCLVTGIQLTKGSEEDTLGDAS